MNAVRSFGLSLVGSVPWGTHLCQFYESKQDLIDILVPYFAEGLRSNEFCIWITSRPLQVEEAKNVLKKSVPNLDEYFKKGQIEILSYEDWYLLGGKFDPERVLLGWVEKEKEALKRGFKGLRLSGNTFWIERDLWKRFVDYEEAVNAVIEQHNMLALCTYCLKNCSGTDVMDVVRNHIGTLIKQEGKWSFVEDTSQRRKAEAALRDSEERLRLKLDSVLSPDVELGEQELANIIDVPALQSMMDDFYAVTKIAFAIIDLKGNVLVGTGWQDICTKFHRVNPMSSKNCVESDVVLTSGVKQGEFRLYKCKNNLWDIVTPLFIGSKHVANLFSGQFFLEGDDINHELFAKQALKYGFDKEKYLAALDRVPVFKREEIDNLMKYCVKLSEMISKLSFSNLKLARSVSEQKRVESALRNSEQRWSTTLTSIGDAVIATDISGNITFMNTVAEELTGWSLVEAAGKPIKSIFKIVNEQTGEEVESPVNRVLKEGTIVGLANHTILVRKTGDKVAIDDSGAPIRDSEGNITGVVLVFRDITERKKAEEELKSSEERFYKAFHA